MSGCLTDGELWIVRQCRADPDDDRVVLRPKEVHARSRLLAGDPFRRARASRDPTVQRERELQRDVGNAHRDELRPGRNETLRVRLPAPDVDAQPRILQLLDASTRDVGVGVAATDDDPRDLRGEDGVRARGRPAHVVARFEGHVEGCTARVLACLTQSEDLGVVLSGAFVVTRADHRTSLHDESPHVRVRRGCPPAASLQGEAHPLLVVRGEGRLGRPRGDHAPSPATRPRAIFSSSERNSSMSRKLRYTLAKRT